MTSLAYTPVAEIPNIVSRARSYFNTHVTKTYEWRKRQIEGLIRLLEENESGIVEALNNDLSKGMFESVTAEVLTVINEARSVLAHLSEWMQPVSAPTPLAMSPAQSYTVYEPYGVVLIIGPFNYPIQLCILPLLAALSAGNVCVVKPSEATPASSLLLSSLLPQYLDPSAIYVVLGAVAETTALLSCHWDYIFFTGSTSVGRVVLKAAAEHLTPVTLELGGKSPAIVDQTADIPLAATRIIWGKMMNAGQSCIAPDYILVHTDVKQQLLSQILSTLKKFYSEVPQQSSDYGRIINKRHVQRLAELIQQNQKYIKYGGKIDEGDRYISPTVLTLDDIDIEKEIRNTTSGVNNNNNNNNNNKILEDEIFGPLLPILTYKSLDSVISYVNSKPKPLAIYLFTNDNHIIDRITRETSSGGMTINDIMMQYINKDLPFGGVGASGMGSYHGHYGFMTLSHVKSIVRKSIYLDAAARYPPYNDASLRLYRYLLSIFRVNQEDVLRWLRLILFGILAAVFANKFGLITALRARL